MPFQRKLLFIAIFNTANLYLALVAGNVYVFHMLCWDSVQFVRFESSDSSKYCRAYTEYYIDFSGVNSQLNVCQG